MGEKPVIIGVDPDTKATGIAVWPYGGDAPLEVYTAKLSMGGQARERLPFMAREIAAVYDQIAKHHVVGICGVEWQKIVLSRGKGVDRTSPNSILEVCAVSGVAVALAAIRNWDTVSPLPAEWSGSIPKQVRHNRLRRDFGLDKDHPMFAGISAADQSHVLDAIGVAKWLARK